MNTPSSYTGFTIIIPARHGSTRLPAKPLRLVAGKTLLEHVYRCAQQSAASEIIIATDDERIESVAKGFGANVCMTSPDHPSGTDRLAEVVATKNISHDGIVINLQGDEPLMPAEVINQVAHNLAHRESASVATVCTPITTIKELFDPNVVKVVVDEHQYAHYFSRAPIPWNRDAFPFDDDAVLEIDSSYQRHIGLYAYRSGFLTEFVRWPKCLLEVTESLEQLRILWKGHKIHVDQALKIPGPGVDTEDDLTAVSKLLQ